MWGEGFNAVLKMHQQPAGPETNRSKSAVCVCVCVHICVGVAGTI